VFPARHRILFFLDEPTTGFDPSARRVLVIFGSAFQHQNVAVAGGRIDEPVYYVPGITYGLIAATFSNLAVSVVRHREGRNL
jgi:hypothetical protein